ATLMEAGPAEPPGPDAPERLDAVSPGEAAEAARAWLDADRLVIVAAGPASAIRPALERIGPVEVVAPESVQAQTPTPVAAAPPPTPEEQNRGREILKRALA